MKNWLKENLVLAVGLTLPLLLILLFFVATVIPKAMSTPPQYTMLFVATEYDYQKTADFSLKFSVKNNQLMVKPKKLEGNDNHYNLEKVFIYDGKTNAMREIVIDSSKFTDGVEIVLDETRSYELDTSSVSPDGYMLDRPHYHDSGWVGGLFGGGYRNTGYRIKKEGIAYKLPYYKGDAYYNQLQFLGWVIKQ